VLDQNPEEQPYYCSLLRQKSLRLAIADLNISPHIPAMGGIHLALFAITTCVKTRIKSVKSVNAFPGFGGMWICRDVRDDACVVDRNPLQRRAHLPMECGHWPVDSLANSMQPINIIDIVLRSSAFICHGF
jgi:hypothetical protein